MTTVGPKLLALAIQTREQADARQSATFNQIYHQINLADAVIGTVIRLRKSDELRLAELNTELEIERTEQRELCDRCEQWTDRARGVPVIIQILTFPITGIFLLKSLFSISTILRVLRFQNIWPIIEQEFRHRYCRKCLRWITICHVVISVWAISFVYFLISDASKN
ncbi:hypothetical protein [Aureliella helgolandensis]|uniref:Uncharacterized protein n=1 Tax=Aureliella helgolandensis TaxID=2527968 RepID=A0A518G2U7_9BACT|nr:hypothetical protein [Aureliella helgolandensis]QDV22890.1 hypothetical protein Q31a_11830 [Aureliella helgolandensis]